MARVRWSDTALADVFAIGEYIAQNSPMMAEHVTLAILTAGDELQHFPKRGRVIPEINKESAREIFYKSYRIMYDISGDDIEITGVIHGARDFKV